MAAVAAMPRRPAASARCPAPAPRPGRARSSRTWPARRTPSHRPVRADWGVCSKSDSPFDRKAMFEHDGCDFYEADPEDGARHDVGSRVCQARGRFLMICRSSVRAPDGESPPTCLTPSPTDCAGRHPGAEVRDRDPTGRRGCPGERAEIADAITALALTMKTTAEQSGAVGDAAGSPPGRSV
jgi:hypothetical protein